jgi:predicted Zn-dependent protease
LNQVLDPSAALLVIKEWRKSDPSSPIYMLAEAQALRGMKRFVESSECLRHAISLHPGDVPLRLELARSLKAQGKAQETAKILDVLLEEAEQDPERYFTISQGCYHMGQHDYAIAAARAALKRDPENPNLMHGLSHMLAVCGQRSEAVLVIQNALLKDPGNSSYLAHLSGLQAHP